MKKETIEQKEQELNDLMDKQNQKHVAYVHILPCIVCGVVKEPVFKDGVGLSTPRYPEQWEHQPYGATTFYTHGHYGSTFWDSFDGEQLVVCICDDCLRKNHARLTVIKEKRRHPTVYVELSKEELEKALDTPERYAKLTEKYEKKSI